MTGEHRPGRVPDLLLERYRLGELPPDETERVATLAEHDEDVRRRLAAMARSDEDIRNQYGATLTAGIRARRETESSAPTRSAWIRWALPVGVTLAVTTVLLLAVRTTDVPEPQVGGPSTIEWGDHIKGLRPALALYRRTPKGSETLADGDVARAGDLIRVGYRAAGRRYGVIVSIDGRGTVTLHLPPNGQQAAALQPVSTVLLDQAYELDDAPRWERFYFVTADAPFDVAAIVEAARHAAAIGRDPQTGALTLPRGLEQSTFSLQKEARP